VLLCSGSTSALPVDCYVWGQANTGLTDRDLIDLCRPLASVPYVPVPLLPHDRHACRGEAPDLVRYKSLMLCDYK
jgi:hypothetical protein